MRVSVQRFMRADGGAVTVDWVILAAAAVGISLAAAGAVGSGVTSLAGDIQIALGDASGASDCQGGAYEARILTGDREREAGAVREQIAGMSDEAVRAGYVESVTKAGILRAAGESDDYVNEVLDYAALYGAELANRRLSDERADAGFAALTGTGGGACGGDGDGGGDDGGSGSGSYDLMALGERGDRMARRFSDEIARQDTRQLVGLVSENERTYYEALAVGDDEKARIMLDQMYLTAQELAGRRDAAEQSAEIEARFQRARAAYQPRRR